MWITQTYLGTVEPEAKVFVYYLFEDYVEEQRQFTEKVQRALERLGESYGSSVSLLMPNPNYADRIEAEVREIRPVWEHVHGALPGLLISTTPLVKLESRSDECYYIPFDLRRSPSMVAKEISEARKLLDKTLSIKFTNRDKEVKPVFRRIGEAIELKPGLFGFRIDLKKLFIK